MNVCIYGASGVDLDKGYFDAVYALGRELAARDIGLVFGGGNHGLMGAAARGVHDGGGRITGVAPSFFDVDDILYPHCTEFIYTETMRERKQKMEELSDAFIVAPGGFGTLEEFFEMLTLKQLGRHHKAIIIYNAMGYYDLMLRMIEDMTEKHFVGSACSGLYNVVADEKQALDCIESYTPPALTVVQTKGINI